MASVNAGTAIGYETLTWDAPAEAGYGLADLRAAQRQAGDYAAAIPAAIAELTVALPAAVVADAEEASNEITRFDAELGDEIAPFAAVLLRSESAASSDIENVTASARAIAEAEALGGTGRRNAAQIVSNTEAMKAAVALADRLDGNAILAMHRALMRDSDPGSAGRWRREQGWIGGGNFGPRGADYIAPHHTRIHESITDLIDFTCRADVPTLPHVAIAHAQFETIHPFTYQRAGEVAALGFYQAPESAMEDAEELRDLAREAFGVALRAQAGKAKKRPAPKTKKKRR